MVLQRMCCRGYASLLLLRWESGGGLRGGGRLVLGYVVDILRVQKFCMNLLRFSMLIEQSPSILGAVSKRW